MGTVAGDIHDVGKNLCNVMLEAAGFEVVDLGINVPGARFVRGDMTKADLPANHFAGAVCLYALIHVPAGEQPDFLARVHRWLRPGAPFLLTIGHEAWTGTETDWLGAGGLMYWSHADEATTLGWIEAAGFEVRWTRFVPERESGHTLLLATRSPDGP